MLGEPPLFITVEGTAILIKDKQAFADHRDKDLDHYFPQGVDTPEVVMIRVAANTIRYWNGADQGEITA